VLADLRICSPVTSAQIAAPVHPAKTSAITSMLPLPISMAESPHIGCLKSPASLLLAVAQFGGCAKCRTLLHKANRTTAKPPSLPVMLNLLQHPSVRSI